MKKTLATLFAILFISLTLVLAIAWNVNSTLLNPDKIKALAHSSNVYDTAAFYIRDAIIKGAQIQTNDSRNLAVLDNTINADSIQRFFDRGVDSIFKALRNPVPGNLVFNITFPDNRSAELGNNYLFERTVNLDGNPVFYYLTLIPKFLLLLLLICVFFLFLIFILADGAGAKLRWLGWIFLVLGILLAIPVAGIFFIIPKYIGTVAHSLDFVRDPKLISSAQKLILASLDWQKIYFIFESAGFIFLSAILFFISKLSNRDKLELPEANKLWP